MHRQAPPPYESRLVVRLCSHYCSSISLRPLTSSSSPRLLWCRCVRLQEDAAAEPPSLDNAAGPPAAAAGEGAAAGAAEQESGRGSAQLLLLPAFSGEEQRGRRAAE